jgi:hypothetical protein
MLDIDEIGNLPHHMFLVFSKGFICKGDFPEILYYLYFLLIGEAFIDEGCELIISRSLPDLILKEKRGRTLTAC